MRLPVSILVVVLMLAAFSSTAQVTYWFSGWQRSGTAQQAQQYFMVPGTGVTFTYATNRVIINSTGTGTNFFTTNNFYYTNTVYVTNNTFVTNSVYTTNDFFYTNSFYYTNNTYVTNYYTNQIAGGATNQVYADTGWSGNPTITNLTVINRVIGTNGLYYVPENSSGVYTNLLQPVHAFAALMGFVTNTINGGANTYAIVTNYSTARTNDMRCGLTTGCITNLEAGLYYCAIHMSAKSLDNGALVEGDLLLNGVVRDEVSFQSEFDPGAPRWKGVSAFGILYIPANTQITFQIKSSGASGIQLRRQQLVVFSP